MFPERALQSGRPPAVTAAFWFQVGTAGLLLLVAVVDAIGTVLFGPVAGLGGTPFSAVLLLALAAWLTTAAFGLRRGSRAAYWVSLAGLVLPLVSVVAASALGLGTTRAVFAYTSASDAILMGQWLVLSGLVGGAVTVIAPGLVVCAVGMLLTGTSRRFFR